MKNIWKELSKDKKPFVALAPMAGVTDFPFREIIAEIGKPDVMFTEFVSTEHIARVSETPLVLKFSKKQRPIIAQFFGSKPEQFEKCAQLALKLGFDGIDINMGCPDRKVLKQGAGSELIKNSELAVEIIRTVKKVVDGKIPVSVKTRIGWDEKNISKYLEILKNIVATENISAITIHGRTAKQGYSGNADWETIGKFTKELKKVNKNLIVIGNGDIKNLAQGKMLVDKYDLDGFMIGRQILKNPWVFSSGRKFSAPTIRKRLKIALKHTELFQKFYGEKASFGAMKKYYKAYLSGFEIKKDLMNAKNFEEAKKILK